MSINALGGNVLSVSGSNVGIGTTTFNHKVNIANTPTLQLQGIFTNCNYTTHGRIYFNDNNFGIGAGRFVDNDTTSDHLYFWSYGAAGRDIVFCQTGDGLQNPQTFTKTMVIQGGTGNVGIATSNPTFPLDIVANYAGIRVGNGSGKGYVAMMSGGGTENPGYISFFTGNTTRVGYVGWQSPVNGYLTLSTENGFIGWHTFGNHLFTGNVCIGTSNVNYPLFVKTATGSMLMQDFSTGAKLVSVNHQTIAETPMGIQGSSVSLQTNGITRLHIELNGNVGIGLSNPGVQLQLSTDGARKLSTTTWSTGSDARVKMEIEDASTTMCYDIVKQLKLKRFAWNPLYYPEVDDRHSLGWIAQDVRPIFPNAVKVSKEHGFEDFHTLNADQINKALYGAVQQLILDKEQLEVTVASLKQRLDNASL